MAALLMFPCYSVYAGEKSIEDKEKRKRTELSNITKEIFKSRKKVSYNDLTELIMDMLDVKERTAKSYIRYMKENEMLSQDSNNYYITGNISL